LRITDGRRARQALSSELLTTFFVTADGLGTQNNEAKITQNNSSLYSVYRRLHLTEVQQRVAEVVPCMEHPWNKFQCAAESVATGLGLPFLSG
jgi:hypothetical protein